MPPLQHGLAFLSLRRGGAAARRVAGVSAVTRKLRCRSGEKVPDRLALRRHDIVLIQKPSVHRAIVVDADQPAHTVCFPQFVNSRLIASIRASSATGSWNSGKSDSRFLDQLRKYRGSSPVIFGPLDLRAQVKAASARRPDTPMECQPTALEPIETASRCPRRHAWISTHLLMKADNMPAGPGRWQTKGKSPLATPSVAAILLQLLPVPAQCE